MHMLFGTAVTLPLLPPVDLVRVRESTAFATATAYYVAGALFGRSASRAVRALAAERLASDLGGAEPAEMLSQNPPVAVDRSATVRDPVGARGNQGRERSQSA
jgi:hypothetical protein